MKKSLRVLILGLLFMLAFVSNNKSVYASNSFVTMLDGASIRVATENSQQGLRFTAKLTGEALEHGFYLVYGKATLEDLQRVIKDRTLILNGKQVFKVAVKGVDKDGNFSVVLTGIPTEGYLDNITVFAYVDGLVSKETTNRSVAEVAIAAIQHGEEDNVYEEIAQTVGNKVLFSSEDVDVPVLENDESLELPVLEKADYTFLGWSTKKGGEVIDDLPSYNVPFVLYPIWKADFELLEKEDSLTYLEELFNNSSFDFLKEGMLKVETEIFINSRHVYYVRDHGMVYDFDMLLDLDKDLELKEFYLNGRIDSLENLIIYGDGTYLYQHTEVLGKKFDEMVVFPLNSQALNMFVPELTEEDVFKVFPASPRALNDVILDIEKDLLSYFIELGLVDKTMIKINGDNTTLTISLDGNDIVEILKKYWPYKDYQYRDVKNLNVDIILNLENDKFERLDIEIKGMLYDYGMISFYYVEEEIIVPEAFNVYNKNKDYINYTLYINEEVHNFKVDVTIIEGILNQYDWSNDRYYDYDEFGYGEVILKPYLFGFDTVGLYKDNEYNEPFTIYDLYDYEVDIYVKTVESLPSIEELVDSYFIDGLAVLKYKTFHGDDAVFYETDKYAVAEIHPYSEAYNFTYYLYDKVNEKHYYVIHNKDYPESPYTTYEVFNRDEDSMIFKDVLKYDNNYKVFNGYFVPEEMLTIKRDMLLLRGKKILNIRDEYLEKTEEDINSWFDSMLVEINMLSEELWSIELDYIGYIDINNLSNLTITLGCFYLPAENLNLLELVEEGLMTYDYVLNEEEKEIAFTIYYLNQQHTYNTNYYDSSKGAYFLPAGSENTFKDGFYYHDIDGLIEVKGNPYMKFIGYMAAINGPLITEKDDLLPYINNRNTIYLYPVQDVREYNEFVSFVSDEYIDIDGRMYYDVENRTFYMDQWEGTFVAIFTDDDITFYNDDKKIVFETDELNDFQIDTIMNMFLVSSSYRFIIEDMIIVEHLFSGKLEFLEFIAEEKTFFNGTEILENASYVFSNNVEVEIDSYFEKLVVTHSHDGYFRLSTIDEFPNIDGTFNYERNYEVHTSLDESFHLSLTGEEELENALSIGYLDQMFEEFYIVVDDVVDFNTPYDDSLYDTSNGSVVIYGNYDHISNYLDALDLLTKDNSYQLEDAFERIIRVSNNNRIDVYRFNKQAIYYEREYELEYSIDFNGDEDRVIYYGPLGTYELHEDFEVFNICNFIENISKDDFIYSDGQLLYVGPYNKDLYRFSINLETEREDIRITIYSISYDSTPNEYFFTDPEHENYKDIVNIDYNFNLDEVSYAEADLATYDNFIIVDHYDDLRITLTFDSGKRLYYDYVDLYEQGKAYIDEENGDYYIYLVDMFDDIKIPLYYEFFDLNIDKVVIMGWSIFYLNELEFYLFGEYETQFNHVVTIAEELLYIINEYVEYQYVQIIYLEPLGGGEVS